MVWSSYHFVRSKACMHCESLLCRVLGSVWLDRCAIVLQGTIVAIENKEQLLYGLQYHPEVQHSEKGIATLKRFLFGIAKMPADWRIENVLKEEMDKIRATVSATSHSCRLL